jgi:hypothetical protein
MKNVNDVNIADECKNITGSLYLKTIKRQYIY